jgi:hypothetical protein
LFTAIKVIVCSSQHKEEGNIDDSGAPIHTSSLSAA